MVEGGCFCGAVRYAFEPGEYRVVNCHCTMCRRTSGAPFVTWVVVPADTFRYVSGTPKVLGSSENGSRHFCDACGTPVVFVDADRPETLDVTVGSLDAPERMTPNAAVHTDTKLPWLKGMD